MVKQNKTQTNIKKKEKKQKEKSHKEKKRTYGRIHEVLLEAQVKAQDERPGARKQTVTDGDGMENAAHEQRPETKRPQGDRGRAPPSVTISSI